MVKTMATNPNLNALDAKDTLLHQSWQAEAWMPILNASNVLDYFAESIFYDHQCNNEVVRMQRLSPDQLLGMVGIEYVLLVAQEPILYVIRKQHRTSPSRVVPYAHYYVIAGKVYQAPDLGNIVNSRLTNCANYLQQTFAEVHSYARYQSAKGYYWEFKDKDSQAMEAAKEERLKGEQQRRKEKRRKEEPSSIFQRQKVDALLEELTKKFPLKTMNPPPAPAPAEGAQEAGVKQEKAASTNGVVENGVDSPSTAGVTSVASGSGNKRVAHSIKTEPQSDKPPEKRPKMEKK